MTEAIENRTGNPAPKNAGVGTPKESVKERLVGWPRYAYFLRFSLLLWCLPGILALLNWKMKSLASGLMVPEYVQGYLCVGFFIASTGYAALASARVTVINGPRRFSEPAPKLLESVFTDRQEGSGWLALLLSRFWSVFFLVFLLWLCPDNKGQSRWMILWGYLLGSAMALLFWYMLNAWYYLTYARVDANDVEEQEDEIDLKARKTAAMGAQPVTPGRASTMIFPRSWFLGAGRLENAHVKQSPLQSFLRWCARWLVNTPGYAYRFKNGKAELYEGQAFLILCAMGFLGLYDMLWPITAPVPVPGLSALMLLAGLIVVVGSIRVFWSAEPQPMSVEGEGPEAKEGPAKNGLRLWKIGLSASVVLFWSVIVWMYLCSSAERFPILGSVVIMAIALLWSISGIGFFLDRYRVPVLIVLLANVLLFHLWAPSGRDEHYFSTVSLNAGVAIKSLPTPAAVLADRLDRLGKERPLIVVTATGGGLHASAWTAAVLRRLEEIFPQTKGDAFHDRLLLLSTVSGGSVGLNAYLHALKDGTINDPQEREHFQAVAQCSSLEAVGWGLIYYDLPKALVPFGPEVLSPSDGNGDLNRGPLLKDRTWSLRKGISRNEKNAYCDDIWARDVKADLLADQKGHKDEPGEVPFPVMVQGPGLMERRLATNIQSENSNQAAEDSYTLLKMLPSAEIPAFAMNTTSVERGARFLLSNYVVPHYPLDAKDGNNMFPAQSFLDTFRDVVGPNDPSGRTDIDKVDLPLATAAQLSATFPYVSSTARAPRAYGSGDHPNSVHFGDGGYYDNDGTASAIEFLRYALAEPTGGATGDDQKNLEKIKSALGDSSKPLKILWIEIRNSSEFDQGEKSAAGGNGASDDDWTLTDQAGAPLNVFWNAGHESVTGRNRHVLDILQQAYGCKLSIYRVVLADNHAEEITRTDPLNWSLTPGQRQEVRMSARRADLDDRYKDARNAMTNWQGPHPCAIADAAKSNQGQR